MPIKDEDRARARARENTKRRSLSKVLVLANFGGPRNLGEIELFLRTLLTDQEVVRTRFPSWLHNWIFSRAAKKRAPKIAEDYALIGGKSPIYEDTEKLAASLSQALGIPVLCFHRYLPPTHAVFLKEIEKFQNILVFPLFPQFSYATTGSIALWFSRNLPNKLTTRLRWIKSYAGHSAFIRCTQEGIREYLREKNLKEEETILLFSAHGVPKKFVTTGDIYEKECQVSFEQVARAFPRSLCQLSYQSRFGPEEWLRPYTDEKCKEILSWNQGYKNVLFIPISFTSDHIETLFEIEYLYLPLIREKGLSAFRLPAINCRPDWPEVVMEILEKENKVSNETLQRKMARRI